MTAGYGNGPRCYGQAGPRYRRSDPSPGPMSLGYIAENPGCLFRTREPLPVDLVSQAYRSYLSGDYATYERTLCTLNSRQPNWQDVLLHRILEAYEILNELYRP